MTGADYWGEPILRVISFEGPDPSEEILMTDQWVIAFNQITEHDGELVRIGQSGLLNSAERSYVGVLNEVENVNQNHPTKTAEVLFDREPSCRN